MGLQNEFKYIKNGNSFPDKNIVHKYYWIFLEKNWHLVCDECAYSLGLSHQR